MEGSQELRKILATVISNEELILAVLSSPLSNVQNEKISIRPVPIKGRTSYQLTEQRGKQVFHHNLSKTGCPVWLEQHLAKYKQSFLYTTHADYHILTGKNGKQTILKKRPTRTPQTLVHNREKGYLLQEGMPIPFLVHLGIMSAEGRVYPSKKDKFRQINRFLEMVDDVLQHLDPKKTVRIVDFGCGKAYLTFALYHYLKIENGFQIHLTGIDFNKDVIEFCSRLAADLKYERDLQFIHGDIENYHSENPYDMVVSLHACDTATDAALEKAIRWNAKIILCVPCCQHELFKQIDQEELRPLLKHGIIKERFAALTTDASRAQLLEVFGYQAQILEFIDVEHTPKNLLIRAIKKEKPDLQHQRQAWNSYQLMKRHLNIFPSLEQRFLSELANY